MASPSSSGPVPAVASAADLRLRVGPGLALRTAWRTTLLNGTSGLLSAALLVLAYLGEVNVAAVLTTKQALLWTVGINVATLLLRAYGVRPIVLDGPLAPPPGGPSR